MAETATATAIATATATPEGEQERRQWRGKAQFSKGPTKGPSASFSAVKESLNLKNHVLDQRTIGIADTLINVNA